METDGAFVEHLAKLARQPGAGIPGDITPDMLHEWMVLELGEVTPESVGLLLGIPIALHMIATLTQLQDQLDISIEFSPNGSLHMGARYFADGLPHRWSWLIETTDGQAITEKLADGLLDIANIIGRIHDSDS